ncbi:MAG: hypothetical protein U0835_17010 [Isosphaeraceae bacterium]
MGSFGAGSGRRGCGMACRRRLRDRQRDGSQDKIHRALSGRFRWADKLDWSRALIDSRSARAAYAGRATRTSPVDPAKPGSNSVRAANVNDVIEFAPL